jgi:excisionase family DNA binding protein
MAGVMYSTEEVADILGLHVRTVRGYVRDGRLPGIRIGKQYRIARDDLAAFTGTHPGPAADGPPRVEVSAVVQVAPLRADEMTRRTRCTSRPSGTRTGPP